MCNLWIELTSTMLQAFHTSATVDVHPKQIEHSAHFMHIGCVFTANWNYLGQSCYQSCTATPILSLCHMQRQTCKQPSFLHDFITECTAQWYCTAAWKLYRRILFSRTIPNFTFTVNHTRLLPATFLLNNNIIRFWCTSRRVDHLDAHYNCIRCKCNKRTSDAQWIQFMVLVWMVL